MSQHNNMVTDLAPSAYQYRVTRFNFRVMHSIVLNHKIKKKQQPSNTTVQHIHTAACFGPIGSSSG